MVFNDLKLSERNVFKNVNIFFEIMSVPSIKDLVL